MFVNKNIYINYFQCFEHTQLRQYRGMGWTGITNYLCHKELKTKLYNPQLFRVLNVACFYYQFHSSAVY